MINLSLLPLHDGMCIIVVQNVEVSRIAQLAKVIKEPSFEFDVPVAEEGREAHQQYVVDDVKDVFPAD